MEFEVLLSEIENLRKEKQKVYGNSFLEQYEKYGKQALFFDLLRKWSRLENMLFKDKFDTEVESLEDTLKDMSVMCLNAIVWLRLKK